MKKIMKTKFITVNTLEESRRLELSYFGHVEEALCTALKRWIAEYNRKVEELEQVI